MFPAFAEVPYYPLVFPLFWGAVLVFGLAMARHLRVFAAARSATPTDRISARACGARSATASSRRGCSGTRPREPCTSASSGASSCWRSARRTPPPAVSSQAVLSWPADGALWTAITALQNAVAIVVLACIAYAIFRRVVVRPSRLTLNRHALVILGLIGAVVATELLAQVFEVAAYGEIPGAFVANALGGALAGLGDGRQRGPVRRLLVGAHGAGRGVPGLPAVRQAPPHRHRHPEHPAAQARPEGPAARDGPRGRGRHVRGPDGRRPVVEGPARRLHVHRVRPLPAGLPGVRDREAAQPQDVHHGHPPRGRGGRGRAAADPQLAVRAGHLRPRRHAFGPRPSPARSWTPRSRTTRSGTA